MFCSEAWLSQAPKISVVYIFQYVFLTIFAILALKACFTGTLIPALFILTRSSVLTWLILALVNVYTGKRHKRKFVGLKLVYGLALRKKKNKGKEKVKVIEKGQIIKNNKADIICILPFSQCLPS